MQWTALMKRATFCYSAQKHMAYLKGYVRQVHHLLLASRPLTVSDDLLYKYNCQIIL